MDEDYLSITAGDTFSIATDQDGYPAVKIQNEIWAELPRWILAGEPGDYDQATRLDELIGALEQLRDLHLQAWRDANKTARR